MSSEAPTRRIPLRVEKGGTLVVERGVVLSADAKYVFRLPGRVLSPGLKLWLDEYRPTASSQTPPSTPPQSDR